MQIKHDEYYTCFTGIFQAALLKTQGSWHPPCTPLPCMCAKFLCGGTEFQKIRCGRSTALHGLLFANLTSYAGRASFTAVGFGEIFPSFPCADAWEIPFHPFTALTALLNQTLGLSCVVRVACHGAAWRSRVRIVRIVRKVRVKGAHCPNRPKSPRF